jgi:hypothetical protein
MKTVKAEVFVVLEPKWNTHGRVTSMKASRATSRQPKLKGNEYAMKLIVEVPASVFASFPEVEIKIPESKVIKPTVTVGDP